MDRIPLLIRALLFGLVAGFVAFPVAGADLKYFDDSNLRSILMLDEFEGWAVGDQGTVWHTMDGGDNWERQPTGTRAMLTGVSMLDFHSGWICGRESVPYGPGSTGLLLFTKDGGGRWLPTSRQDLSGVRKVQFLDEQRAWAVGESTDQNPSGLFHTVDGGQKWEPWRGFRYPGWTTAHFFDFEHGILGGYGRSFANYQQGVVLSARCDWQAGSTVHDLAIAGDRVWVVGSQAQIFVSPDRGRSWRRSKTEIPEPVRRVWDFHGVTAVGDKVWAIGRPGSIVYHSPDGGATWIKQKTPTRLPMNDIQFTDERHGWAVGAMGIILATEDGGENWTIQRKGGLEAAMLWLMPDPAQIPLTVVARHGGAEGYHNVAFTPFGPDLSEDYPSLAGRQSRFEEGFRAAGGTFAESTGRVPLAADANQLSEAALEKRIAALEDGRGAELIGRELVLAIRLWRPRVIVTGAPNPTGRGPDGLVAKAALAAARAAADPNQFPEQLAFFEWSEHGPRAVYQATDGAAAATVRLSAAEYSPALLENFADAAEVGAALVQVSYRPVEKVAPFALRDSNLDPPPSGTSLLAGVSAAPGSECRRMIEPIDEEELAAAEERARKKTTMLALADDQSNVVAPETLLANLKTATDGLTINQAGQLLFQVGRFYVDTGRWELANAVYEHLLQSQPQHPLALEACQWLIAFQTSGEAFRRLSKPAVLEQGDAQFTRAEGDAATRLLATGKRSSLMDTERRNQSLATAIAFGNWLHAASPHLWSDPRVQLCLHAAYRELGNAQVPAAHRAAILEADPDTRWRGVVELEKWLANPVELPPRPIAWSTAVVKRPYLDGRLDEGWASLGKWLPLNGSDRLTKSFATKVRFWHDDRHLYVYAECAVPPGTKAPAAVPRTGHDAELADSDRIELLLDIDRDYSSFFRLAVDRRGQVAEDCWHDRTWNPKWFVATGTDEGTGAWSVEAAIPLEELVDSTDLTDQTWAVNVVRVVPGEGVLSWSQPAGVEARPEGFSILKFVTRDAGNIETLNAN